MQEVVLLFYLYFLKIINLTEPSSLRNWGEISISISIVLLPISPIPCWSHIEFPSSPNLEIFGLWTSGWCVHYEKLDVQPQLSHCS